MAKWFGTHYDQKVHFSSAVKCKKRYFAYYLNVSLCLSSIGYYGTSDSDSNCHKLKEYPQLNYILLGSRYVENIIETQRNVC